MPTITTPAKYRFYQNSWYTHSSFPGVWIHSQGNSDASMGSGSDVRVTNSNRDWRTQVAKGIDASTSYTRSVHTIQPARISAQTSSLGSAPFIHGTNTMVLGYPNFASWTSSADASLQDLALTRLKRKLNTEIGSFNSLSPGVELRELRQLLEGMKYLTTQALNTLIDIKRTRGKSAFKYASNAWLTFNFGVSPLIRDTKEILLAINKFYLRADNKVHITSSAHRDWFSSSKDTGITGAIGAEVRRNTTYHHHLSYKYISGYNLPLKSANNYDIYDHLGLDLKSLVPAFWELTAYSWVVDYFVNVGSYLEDAFTSPPGNAIYVVLNKKYTVNIQSDIYHHASAGYRIDNQTRGMASGTYFEFTRTPIGTALPRIGIRFKTPDEIASFGVTKLLNLASILLK